MTFNLLDEPWIPVVSQGWQRRDVSLVELFDDWHSLREIQGDNPPTTLAIYRFLLAILHRAYQGPKNVDHWEEIQQDNGKKAIAYLNQWRDRFDLFHPDYPFMQDLALASVKEPVPIYVASLMQPAGKGTVFSHTHLWGGYSITPAEAACVLIRLQALDVAGTRAQYPGTTGSRSGSAPPTINSANVIILAKNLKNTLLRNLIEYNPDDEVPKPFIGEDIAFWEIGYAGKPQQETDAKGYIRYLTYPWRRLLLVCEQDRVSRIFITMGNSISEDNKFSWDYGFAYEKGKAIRLSSQKLLWRNVHVFLPPPPGSSDFSCPRVVDWVAKLYREELISENIARLQIFGLCVNKDNAAEPEFWSCEQLSVPSLYLYDENLWKELKRGIEIAENHKRIFSSGTGSPYFLLAEGLNSPSTNSKTVAKQASQLAENLNGESRYWATLDRSFQRLLEELPKDKTVDGNGITYGNTKLPEWTKTVQRAARDAFTESIAPIRNFEARAKALQVLEWRLADLRATPEEKEARKAKAASRKKQKVAK